jgi:hypothetical protein
MKNIKTFETWNNNIIDDSLFSSGKAKYDPKVVGGAIKYKTGTIEPYYFAEIIKKGEKFICKIYKKKKDGEEIRLRKKILKLAHNYVREFLNQKLKKKDKNRSKKRDRDDVDRVIREEPSIFNDTQMDPTYDQPTPMPMPMSKPKSKTIIRRY